MSAFKPNYISTAELARILGISRVAVLKRIQKRLIPAIKIGRSYAIPESIIREQFPKYKSQILDDQAYVSVIEAAQILGVSRFAISKRIERGQLKAKKVGRHYVIARKDIEFIKSKKSRELVTEKEYLSIPECAHLLQVSRIAIYKKVKKGTIKAKRVGRHYVIAVKDVASAVKDAPPSDASVGEYWSVMDVAKYLGISRIAVFKKIEKGSIKAIKIGRSYAVLPSEIKAVDMAAESKKGRVNRHKRE